jgi:shikimate dehydrogenase
MNEIFSAGELIGSPEVFSRVEPPVCLGVFGDPVAHSKSPGFHNAALEALRIPARYARIHVTSGQLTGALRALPSAGFFGVNVTIPHKAAALSVVDTADDYALRAGGVNTVVVEGSRLLGFNTDGPGFVRAIRDDFSVDLRDLRVVLLGAGGGAGRAIAVQCAIESCERLVLVNRTFEKAAALASELEGSFRADRLLGPADRIVAVPMDGPALKTHLEQADLVINATSVGMRRTDPVLIPSAWLTANLMVYDAVYASGMSRLLEDAAAAGARTANGLSMLLHQGALSFEIWFNKPAPLDVMRAALFATA